ncbi:protein kinase STUNTED-like isoform X2 [Ziziphus jujuba]|uniref:Protein kinase STUNTED-like isoform X2 n=1 Tax=Ziziphus jujuba TaxID=326968 RepID=A0ABM3ILL6_ZIZJJ|nr:protein kinase STUNTED-like isoform X2 [Ziziphus jujuba]
MIKKVYSSKITRRSHIRVVRLNYDPVTVAKPRLRLSISGIKDNPKVGGGSHKMRKIYLKGSTSRRSWVKKYTERVAKQYATMVAMKGKNQNESLIWVSFARVYANQLPATIITLAIYKGKFLIKRRWARQKEGCRRVLSLELYLKENHGGLRDRKKLTIGKANHDCKEEAAPLRYVSILKTELPESTLGWPLLRSSDSEQYLRRSGPPEMSVVQWVMSLPNRFQADTFIDQETDISTVDSEVERDSLRLIQSYDDKISHCDYHSELVSEQQVKIGKSSVSSCLNESTLSIPGWPLLHIAVASLDSLRESEIVCNPKQIKVSPLPQFDMVSNKTRNPSKRHAFHPGIMNNENCLVTPEILVNELVHLVRTNSSGCTRFSYAELKIATNQFSPDNLIGEGGCSSVYRGCFPSGKSIAVKILKPYKEAWNDFSLEVEILSSITHRHITPLVGLCAEDIHLISVYDLYPKGSLEENLHGRCGSSKLPWKVRFKVAVSVAEALNYLHNDGPRPVIHRDIKSSNILLTDELQPQLSDFGLAIWGSTNSYVLHSDVVGTFGYIAPEYFMNGRVSDKIDVYAFGVILLELLSGRRPISNEVPKGQESLVKWAKHLLERGDTKALLDPELNGDFDDVQVQRMVLAARLCISQSTRVRPKVSQILKLLRGKEEAEECVDHVMDPKELGYEDDDDLVLEFGCQRQSGLASLDAGSAIASSTCAGTSPEKVHRRTLKDYLEELQD